MIKLNDEFLKESIKSLSTTENKRLLNDDIDRSSIYNGKVKDVVMEAIKKEFKKPETVDELGHRLIPINIVQKIINKLGQVYIEPPVRKPDDGDEDDTDAISVYEEKSGINTQMKVANRHFKLYKRTLVEIYLNKFGQPSIRPIDRPNYHVFSSSAVSPEIPECVLKIVRWDDVDPKKSILEWWTDDEYKITDGEGATINPIMSGLENKEGKNPYGTMPFVYINESRTDLVPVADDDLLRNGVVIPLLLSDLAFATKYNTFGIIYTVGVDGEIPNNPNSVINLEFGDEGQIPSINTIKPEVDIEKLLLFIETVVAMLLSTKNLSAGTVQGKLTTENIASGISKMLDNAETLEDRKEQTAYFSEGEKKLWNKLTQSMVPYWMKNGMILDDEMKHDFSKEFKLSIHFPEPKVIQSEQEKMAQAKFRIDNGFSTLRIELKKMNPTMSDVELDTLVADIEEARQSKVKELTEEFNASKKDND